MGIINEAGYKLRRSYVVLMALWYGNKKPPMGPFLDASIDELNRLQEHGFSVKGRQYKVRVLVITTDTVARPLVIGTTQFNGLHGCSFCLAEGQHVKKGRGGVRVYPEPPEGSPLPALRTLDQHTTDLAQVLRTKKRINGIVTSSPLSRLTGFDYVRAQVPEYLHSCCEGVFKLLVELWTSKKHRKNEWYIGDKIALINAKLINIEPPYEVTRTTAGVDKLKVWKASMYRSFTLYYFHILEGVLPIVYFQHFCQLVYGITLLLRERVSVADINKVDILFRHFVREFEFLYGIEDVRINIHFLTHLAKAVLDWGCLWSTSTFIPEWFNGELNKLCHGTQGIVDQMGANYLLRQEVKREVVALMQSNSLPSHVSSQLREYLNLPTTAEDDISGTLINKGKAKLLGSFESRDLTMQEEVAFRNLFTQSGASLPSLIDPDADTFGTCHSYPIFKIQATSSRFTTTSYTLSPKRVNYCALMDDGTHLYIDSILRFDSIPDCAFVVGRSIGTEGKRAFTPEPVKTSTGLISFTTFPQDTVELHGIQQDLTAYSILSVESKCVLSLNNSLMEVYTATSLVNSFESD